MKEILHETRSFDARLSTMEAGLATPQRTRSSAARNLFPAMYFVAGISRQAGIPRSTRLIAAFATRPDVSDTLYLPAISGCSCDIELWKKR
ncbi:hypothetical protein [Nocardia sp. NPDC004711]